MSKEKKGAGTPAVVTKKGNKTTYKCGKKNSLKKEDAKKEDKPGVGNEES